MEKIPNTNNRRDFLKKCGLSSIPFLIPTIGLGTLSAAPALEIKGKVTSPVNFASDGQELSPTEYLYKLKEIDSQSAIKRDVYGQGGATKLLEEAFAKLTGKEKAIYFPTGTMANQVAISMLNEEKTKILVPENSHIYRDEADAAQSIHHKRLIPVGKGKAHFNLNDLMDTIKYHNENEVFASGMGTVAIENPVRRADGTVVPLETIKEVSEYCRNNGLKLHLDGARIHLASAYTNISIAEYASYFDTVYISLYKYLNASAGSILCGDAEFIDSLSHQIKILGGTMYQTWTNTAMALHYLGGIEERWAKVIQRANQLIVELNKIEGVSVTSLKNGTNIYHMQLADNITPFLLTDYMSKNQNINLRSADNSGLLKLMINESLMARPLTEVVTAWKNGIKEARKL
jgi:threonine aldolase